MRIPLDRQEEKPPCRQTHDFLPREILTGALQEDARLPSTRSLASEMGVSRITVTNAYAELEVEGLIYTRLGNGTYVAPGVERILRDRERETALDHWPLWQQNLVLDAWPTSSRGDRIAAFTSSVEGTISFAPGVGSDHVRFTGGPGVGSESALASWRCGVARGPYLLGRHNGVLGAGCAYGRHTG